MPPESTSCVLAGHVALVGSWGLLEEQGKQEDFKPC